MNEFKYKVKKIIVQCPHCGHLYIWLVSPLDNEDCDCDLEVCEYCQKVYFSGPANRVKCLACNGKKCIPYEISYKESGLVKFNGDNISSTLLII